MARGSLSELDTQFVIAPELGHVNDATAAQQLEELSGLPGGPINSVRQETNASSPRQ